MFTVPREDRRLRNKAEVLVMRPASEETGERRPVAIAAEFLKKTRLYQGRHGGRDLLVITSVGGANRAYDASGVRFSRLLSPDRLADEGGRTWRITEEALADEGDAARRLPRLAAQRAFWFGWVAQFPDTELVK